MEGSYIDSSVLVGFFNEKDSLHKKAQTVMQAANKPLLIHEYIALETASVLLVRAGKVTADAFLKQVLNNTNFNYVISDEVSFLEAAELFMRNKSKLSFIDIKLLVLSRTNEVITFDDALARAIKKKAAL